MARAQNFFALDNKGAFFKLNNPGDPKFNQLLGINDHDIIAGYFGDGMGGPGSVFNNGYVLVPNTHYSVENFAGTPPSGSTITQTQAIGINSKNVPDIVGFWADQSGLQFGFEDVKGVFTTIFDSNANANPEEVRIRTFSASITSMRLPVSGLMAPATNTVSLLTLLSPPAIY